MLVHLKMVKINGGSKISAGGHTIPKQFESGMKFDGTVTPRILMPKKCTYAFKINQPCFKRVKEVPFSSFSCVHSNLFQNMLVRAHFSTLPFSKSASTYVPFSCEKEFYPSHFAPSSNHASIA